MLIGSMGFVSGGCPWGTKKFGGYQGIAGLLGHKEGELLIKRWIAPLGVVYG